MNRLSIRQRMIDRIDTDLVSAEIICGGIRTAYLSAGTGHPLILLHGAGAGAVTWYPAIADLARHFCVIAPDIVGYGETDKPDGDYDRAFFTQWLRGFIDAMALSTCHLAGISQGGAIAMQYAIDCPERVDRLAVINAGGFGAKASVASLVAMIAMHAFPSRLANRAYAPFILTKPARRHPDHADYSLAVLKSDGGKKAFQQGRGAAVAAFSDDSLRQIKQETLILWGENDRLFPVEAGKRASTRIPNAQFLSIPDAGHLCLMEQPETFNEKMTSFFLGAL